MIDSYSILPFLTYIGLLKPLWLTPFQSHDFTRLGFKKRKMLNHFFKRENAPHSRYHTSFAAFIEVHLNLLMSKEGSQTRQVLYNVVRSHNQSPSPFPSCPRYTLTAGWGEIRVPQPFFTFLAALDDFGLVCF